MRKLTKPPVVEGYAAVFNQPSTPVRVNGRLCREVIRPGAFDWILGRPKRFPPVWYNHNAREELKRSPISLEVDDYGLRFAIEFPYFGDWLGGWRLVHGIRYGEISGCSFSFSESNAERRLAGRLNGTPLSEVLVVYAIGEITITRLPSEPAYPGTFCRAIRDDEKTNRMDRHLTQLEKQACRV